MPNDSRKLIDYPIGTVHSLLDTDLVTKPTRDALSARLATDATPAAPRFFDTAEFATLAAICDTLLPHLPEGPPHAACAHKIDTRLASGTGNGWRYDALPPDGDAYRVALRALNAWAAQAADGVGFVALTASQRQTAMHDFQAGQIQIDTWQESEVKHFFQEVLADLSEAFYSDPRAQEAIGYVGMADARGWLQLGLNRLETWEPRPLNDSDPSSTLKITELETDTTPEATRSSGTLAEATRSSGTLAEATRSSGTLAEATRSSGTLALAAQAKENLSIEVDAVVIGTGAGGAPLLARLAQAGLKVVALEAGKWWDPRRDFATDEVAQEKLFWNDERLSAGGDPVAFGNNNSGTGVGGSTLHYTAYTPRPQPDDFQLYSDFGVGSDWPIGYDDLEPYFDELEAFLGVCGPSPYPWGPARRSGYPLPPLPLNGAAQLMQRGCEKLGIRTSPAANAALSAPYFQPGVGWRAACTNRGFCQAGCSVGAKASMDVTFVPLAVQSGAEVRSECFVTAIERDESGAVTGVVYAKDGVECRQACRTVFLCAGAIETPRMLLLNRLGNSSGQVGRNFMAHTGVQLWAQFDEDVRPYKGIPGGLISEETHRPSDADFAGGYLLQSIGVMPITYATQLARGPGLWGESLDAHMRGYNHVAGINILGECLPHSENFVELSDENDARGLPKPRVHFTNGENENRLTAHALAKMRAIWDAAGAKDPWVFPRNAHIIGTCRMGNDPATSVVDSDGAVHDVPGLYICDNSVFPSALSANPALTITALSLRTADRFLESRARA